MSSRERKRERETNRQTDRQTRRTERQRETKNEREKKRGRSEERTVKGFHKIHFDLVCPSSVGCFGWLVGRSVGRSVC